VAGTDSSIAGRSGCEKNRVTCRGSCQRANILTICHIWLAVKDLLYTSQQDAIKTLTGNNFFCSWLALFIAEDIQTNE